MLSIAVNMQKTGDSQKIQKFAHDADVEVLVGFLSGKKHVPTLHRQGKGKAAQYRGIDGGEPDFSAVETAELAKTLSFGGARIPPRPFIEEGLGSRREEIKKEIGAQLENAKNGRGANWDKVGTMAVGAVQEFVRGGYYKSNVPNSKRTQEYKGSDTPLIDGGDLINSLEYIVEGGSA